MSLDRRFQPLGAHRRVWLLPLALLVILILTWQIALAQAPLPNPLAPLPPGGNSLFAPVPGADISRNGDAVNLHGDPGRGRLLFAQNCIPCHNERGIGGLPNPGSDDGTVPPLNPIDSGFLEGSQGDPAIFAREIDLFIQHGSRPDGDDPVLNMVPWGDKQLRTQSEIADLESYVMQLNGVYWPDRFYPPAEVQMRAVRSGSTVTYTINLINHGSSSLGDWTLKDTLPQNLSYLKSGILGLDRGTSGQLDGSTVQWVGGPNVPQGGSLGPFLIVAAITGDSVPANVAELRFTFSTYSGNLVWAGAVSDPTLPVSPKGAPSLPPGSGLASQPKPAPAAQPTSAPTVETSLTPATAAATTEVPTSTEMTATPVSLPTSTEATPTQESSNVTPTPTAAAPAAANFDVQMVQPQPSALSWEMSPPQLTIHVGDTVTWFNAGTLAHAILADDGSFQSPGLLNPGDTWSYTFTSPGTFSYHCSPHPWMKGTVIVLATGQ